MKKVLIIVVSMILLSLVAATVLANDFTLPTYPDAVTNSISPDMIMRQPPCPAGEQCIPLRDRFYPPCHPPHALSIFDGAGGFISR